MIHYPTECSSLPILSFFACPSDSEFSGISKNPRDLLKVIFSLEKPLRERNHVNCAPSPLCPVHFSLKVIFQSQKFFSTPVVHIFPWFMQKNTKYIITTAILLHVLGRREGKKRSQSAASVLKQLTGFSSITWIT